MFKPSIIDPKAIEAESFRIIDSEMPAEPVLSQEQHAVARRVIHATADFEFARNLRFHPGAFESFYRSMREGRDIVADVQMVEAGISKATLANFGGKVWCPISEEETAAAAKAAGHTRSMEGMRLAARRGHSGPVVIGNAPTALTECLRLIRDEGFRPALLIGVPVGFVSAVESKAALAEGQAEPVPYITCLGRKGGTPCAVAAVNALLLLAAGLGPVKG